MVLFCFCSNGKKGFSQRQSLIPQSASTHRHHYNSLPTPSTPLLTPSHLFPSPFSQFSLSPPPPIRLDPSTPPSTIHCAISHLRRAVSPLNEIIIGPALLLIAKMTIGRTCAWLKARASGAAADASVAGRMSVDRCACWSRTGGERGDLDINEMVTKLTLVN